MSLSRRAMVAGMAAAALAPGPASSAGGQKVLRLQSRQIEVGGKAATRYGVSQASGEFGLMLNEGDDLDVRLENALRVPSGLHWHGLIPPWRLDGVPWVSGPPVMPGQHVDYKFPARPFGTRWMHSHFGLQEQDLLAAPLIVREASAARSGAQEVVILLQDFSWSSPSEIYENLRKPRAAMAMNMSGGAHANMSNMGSTMNMSGNAPANMPGSAAGNAASASSGMTMAGPDLNDVTYDAFLANDRTLADPQVINVERGAEVHLRLINAASASNFTIDLGPSAGTLVAVDGNPVTPLQASRFPLAIAQRIDVMLRLPADGGSVPVLARNEGRTLQTGVILRPPGAAVTRISSDNAMTAPVVGLDLELRLRAAVPLPARSVDRSVPVELVGSMADYSWGMRVHGMGGVPVTVKKGERVELAMRNLTMMAHPMHLHGHNFQVTEIDGQRIAGAVRDSVLVPPQGMVKVVFDADEPGLWAFHCHNLYHMEAGMFTTVAYEGFT